MDPLRAAATFEVIVVAPDRVQRLAKLLLEFSQRLYQFEAVKTEIAALNPTREELSSVLDSVGG